jgi:hypothetical protein
VLALTAGCCVERESAHHLKARGEQRALPALRSLAAELANRGWLARADEFFDRPWQGMAVLADRLAAEGRTR